MTAERQPGPLPPLLGGILIGGASRRMGAAKALLDWGGSTFIERIAGVLAQVVPEICLFGAGIELPAPLARHAVVEDAAGVRGPLAGLLAAGARRPGAAWLMLSCDQPLVTAAALRWLIGGRRTGRIAVLPRLVSGRIEPFPGIYEPECRAALLELAAGERGSLQPLAALPAVHVARVPGAIAGELCGANSPEELAVLRARAEKPAL